MSMQTTQLATGITDNELRASFQRLSVSTKDVTQSQKLLTLAIDVSKGTGKELGTVVEALSKAYEGQDRHRRPRSNHVSAHPKNFVKPVAFNNS